MYIVSETHSNLEYIEQTKKEKKTSNSGGFECIATYIFLRVSCNKRFFFEFEKSRKGMRLIAVR
jgi:hypothetical protein